jgi:hypothetical protein
MLTRRIKILFLTLLAMVIVVLAVWIVIPWAGERNQNVALGKQWMSLLKKHPVFSAQDTGYLLDVKFYYSKPTDDSLKKLRDLYDLETVAGKGSEIEQIINLMSWVCNLTGHANEPEIPRERNAFTLIHMAKVEKKQINCYMKTVILNEVYLAMGFYSRHTHLLPHSNEENESHFITSVYSRTLGKWILMDPDFGVYVTDKKGTILGVMEIRRNLIAGEPMEIKCPGESSLAMAWSDIYDFMEGADYLWFLSDFIFKIRCPKNSMFDQDSKPAREYYELIPDGYQQELLQKPDITGRGNTIYYLNDEKLFWFEPAGQLY